MTHFKAVKVISLLREAREKNILISREDNDLKIRCKKELMSQGFLETLKRYKNDILSYLILSEKWKNAKSPLLKIIASPVQPIEKQSHYDTMHQQEKEYLRFLITGKNTSNAQFTVYFKNLKKGVLEDALSSIFQRHESLRTTFINIYGDVRQVVHEYKRSKDEISYIDLSAMEEKEIIEIATKELNAYSFDLERGPLVSVKVIQLPQDISVLVFTMNHVISDGESIEILKREIDMLYSAYLEKGKNPLPPLKLQYKDYSNWINMITNSEEGKICWDLYKQMISESLSKEREDDKRSYRSGLEREMRAISKENSSNVCIDAAYGKVVTLTPEAGAMYTIFVDERCCNKLKGLSVVCNVSLFTILISAFASVFYRKNRKSVRLSIPFSTRVVEEFQCIIGWLTQDLIICIDIEEDMSVMEFIEVINNIIWESSDFRFYPHERIMKDLDVPLNLLAPGYINFLKKPNYVIGDFHSFHSTHGKGIFDIKCIASECKNGIVIEMQYNINKYCRNEIEQIGHKLLSILEKITIDHGLSLKSILTEK
ncbi:condensation domain-containing protein [Niastella populi]|uniref:Condensation domain-containing protein n=1 Tax=Niastella populi TaxID=550983 RepID=A0A1V9FKN8_9BACT|nr:condensation domain-containing protein [Niastella populi]OQP58857.1 hypothetical protein A4R26_21995 [Niastella populi]